MTIYSDSEYTIKTINGVLPANKNTELWVALNHLKEKINGDFIWQERNTMPQTVFVDAVCTTLRRVNKRALNDMFNDYKDPEKSIGKFKLPEE